MASFEVPTLSRSAVPAYPAALMQSQSSGSFSPTSSPHIDPNAQTAASYLESTVRQQVVSTLQKTLKAHPEKPLSSFIQTLRESNPNRETKQLVIPKIVEIVTDANLTAVKYKRRRDRLTQHPTLPLHIEINPTIDNMLTTISEAKTKFESQLQKEVQAVTSGDASHGADTTSLVSSALSRQAKASDVTDYGKAAAEHLPRSIEHMNIFLLTPQGRECVFVDGVGYIGDVALKRSARKTDYSFVRNANASTSKKESKSGNPNDDWSDSDSDASSELLEEQQEIAEDLEQEVCNMVQQYSLGRKSFPADALEKQLSQLYSKSASNLNFSITRIKTPADRLQIAPELIDTIDAALGIEDSSPCVPTVVFVFGFEQEMILRNIVTVIATTLNHHYEVKQHHINQLIQIVRDEKKRIRLENQATGNQFTMNPSGYWMKVRERREARDRRREQILLEKKKKAPMPPLPSNMPPEERAAAEADRQRAAEEREAYLKNLDRRLHEAALKRQARRATEDTKAAEAITKSFASAAMIVQSIIRGFLTRRKIRNKNLRRQSFRDQYDAASPQSKANIIERYAAHSYKGKHRNRTETEIPWAIERDILMSLAHDYPEAITSLVPRQGAKPKVYKTWLPERSRVPPAHDDDVSSEDESWICTTREVHPRLQTARYRMVNPYSKTQKQLEACKCDLEDYLRTCDLHFSKISPLQRRAFSALQAKCMHMLHTAFLELYARDQLGPLPRQLSIGLARSFAATSFNNKWTFSAFLALHRPELESWFNFPSFVSERLHEVAMKHSSIIPTQMPSHNASTVQIPLLANHFIAFEDLNAGKNWASMAETTAGKGKLAGAAAANYMRGEGCVQLGPTRVWLVSDTMSKTQIQANLLALHDNYKCKKLRWISTSPFPTAYVYDRAVFACQYSEHLAKTQNVFRNVNEVMLEGKLNPEAAAARARAVAERRLAEKQALEKSQLAERQASSSINVNPLSPTNKNGGFGAAGGAPGGVGADRPRPGLRSGFVGRTVANRGSRAPSQITNNPTPEPATARGELGGGGDSNNEGGAYNNNNNNINLTSPNLSTAPTPRPGTNIVQEPNTAVIVKAQTITDKLTVKKKQFAPLPGSGGGGSNQHLLGGGKDSFLSNHSGQSVSHTPSKEAPHQHESFSAIGATDATSMSTGLSALAGEHMTSHMSFSNGEGHHHNGTSMVLRADLQWFGTSWNDLDARFTAELIKMTKDEAGSLYVLIPSKGFEDPTPKPIEDILGKSSNPSNAADNASPTSGMEGSILNQSTTSATHRLSRAHSQHQQNQQQKSAEAEKKVPSGLTLMLGRFPTRTSPLVADIRSFKALDAKTVRIVVTLPLKKTNSAHSLGSGGALGGRQSQATDLGASTRGLGSQSLGLRPGVSNVAAVKLGGGSATGPRTQSRMVRSMSRVTAAVPGGGTSSLSMKKGSCAVESDEDNPSGGVSDTPPPDPASLIVSPKETFSKLFAGFDFDDASFVRFPCLSLGGQPWIQTVSQLMRESYLHMQRGGPEEACTVISVSTSDDIFYAFVVALIHEVLFSEETLSAKARKAAAHQNAAINAHNLPNKDGAAGGVKFGADVNNSANLSPSKGGGADHISKLSTGLSKVASRRFQPVAQAPPPDSEDFTLPSATLEEIDAFGCIQNWIEKHEQDSVELSFAAQELDCMIHKCGLWTTFKMPVIESKRKAEMCRGSLDIRQHVRDACCGLERYLWLLVITRCLTDYRASNPRRFADDNGLSRASLSIQKGQETPQLMPFVEWRLGKQFFEFLHDGIDPWFKTPKLSPDFGHNQLYSMYPQRWYRAMFTTAMV